MRLLKESRGQGGLIKFIVAFIQIWLGMYEYSFGEEQLERSVQCVLWDAVVVPRRPEDSRGAEPGPR